MKLLGVLGVLLLVACSTGPGIQVVHEPSEKYEAYAQAMEDWEAFTRAAEFLNDRFKHPPDLVLRTAECGTANAKYSPKNKELLICYEVMEEIVEQYKEHDTPDAELGDALNETLSFIFFHELGHAIVHLYDIPITGREEDAVDQLAIAILAENDREEALVASALYFKFRMEDETLNKELYWDDHSFDEQRFYNILCWAYGKDPEKYVGAIEKGGLPAGRAKNCEWEYYQMHRSWSRLLEPYLR